MTVTITHVYDDHDSAENVVRELERDGFTSDQISVAGRKPADGSGEEGVEGAATGATLGGVAGAGAGLLASLGFIAIPGIGPLVAAGVLATTLAGAATGAIAGGILGALADYGISQEEAPVYAESIGAADACLGAGGGDEGRGGACHAAPRADEHRGARSRLPGAGLAELRSGRAILHGKGAPKGARPQSTCAVTRRRFPVGASPPGELAPAGSNRSSHGGNEMAEAFG